MNESDSEDSDSNWQDASSESSNSTEDSDAVWSVAFDGDMDLSSDVEENQSQIPHHNTHKVYASSVESEQSDSEKPDQLLIRQLWGVARGGVLDKRRIMSRLVPSGHAQTVLTTDAKPYCAQFSHDGSMLYCATQDFKLHIMDTTRGFRSAATIDAAPGRWTITDCDLARDSRTLIYASIHDTVYLVNLSHFVDSGMRDATGMSDHIPLSLGGDFGVWSVRLSDDGREVVAGCSDGLIFVYDIETRQVIHQVQGHADDVNAVTFADLSSNVLISGSDDSIIKVWDRRSSLPAGKPAGVLTGHTEGITFITTKDRDGRTAVSNGKDQTMKVWDLRKMLEYGTVKSREACAVDLGTNFDYRWQPYPRRAGARKHPFDVSVATYTGHSVLRTLIRCHFSPASTSNRYLYTGSSDGSVYIYDPVAHPSGGGPPLKILKSKSTSSASSEEATSDAELQLRMLLTRAGEGSTERNFLMRLLRQQRRAEESSCARDVAWNPNEPTIVASMWRGDVGSLEAFEFAS
ncbi:DDB1- and CUL4-associated factor 11 [Chytriomyces hyalinus]|nr:DDB1- and CUL4-associated factor 11 [Chytriomyces hyalinus]